METDAGMRVRRADPFDAAPLDTDRIAGEPATGQPAGV
jgi:hypothetical protein